MRTDTRVFMAVLYIFPLGAGLYIIKDRKSVHIFIGILLNIFGIILFEFGLNWNETLETGQLLVGEEVVITIDSKESRELLRK